MENKIKIDQCLCVRCGQCIIGCPIRLFTRPSVDDYPHTVEMADDYCIACHHCVAGCPVCAITVDDVDTTKCQDFVKESIPRFEHIATLVRMRRSIRRYADRPLDERVIEQLMDAVRWAPSAKNGLPVKWIVVNDIRKVQELAGLVVNCLRAQPGCTAIGESWDKGIDPIFRHAPCVIVAYTDETAVWPEVDVTIAVETLDLCVAAMRLGSCWAGFFIQAAKKDPAIKKWLGLSDSETVYGGLMVGEISDEAYQRIPYRPELSLKWIR